jgi:uncharacterized protein (DUF2336 family)
MAKTPLTAVDVEKLLADPSPQSRSETAVKVASSFGPTLGDTERGIAEEIFRIMAKDAETRVREALADCLKDNPSIPKDVALSLASDVDSVSLPIIEFSEVLTDDDLLAIIATDNEAKQIAVAQRPQVSEQISRALVDTERGTVVSTLVANDGAEISREIFDKVVETLGDHADVQEAMVRRRKLPVAIAGMADFLVLQSREKATVALSGESSAADVMVLVRQLHESGRLTSSIILRALCVGDLPFFEASLSVLTGVPLANTRKLIYDPGELGLQRIYIAAKLPEPQFIAARATVRAVEELEYDGIEDAAQDRQRFSRRLIEIILTQYDELGVEFESDDLDYLITKIDGLPPDYIEVLDPTLGGDV